MNFIYFLNKWKYEEGKTKDGIFDGSEKSTRMKLIQKIFSNEDDVLYYETYWCWIYLSIYEDEVSVFKIFLPTTKTREIDDFVDGLTCEKLFIRKGKASENNVKL